MLTEVCGVVSYDLDCRETRLPRPYLQCQRKGPHQLGSHTEKVCGHRIHGYGILTHAQEAAPPRRPGTGPVSLHGNDPVNHTQPGPDDPRDLKEKPREGIPILPGPEVPGRLPCSYNTPEQILHRERQKHLPVGLDLRKIDHGNRAERLSGKLELPKEAPLRGHRPREADNVNAQGSQCLSDAAGRSHFPCVSRPGAVPHGRPCSGVQGDLCKGPYDHGMGAHCRFRRSRTEQIRFEKNGLTGTEEPTETAKQVETSTQCALHGNRPVVPTREDSNNRCR